MSKRILMFVFNDITKDSRVLRSADSLKPLGNITLISCGPGTPTRKDIDLIQYDIRISSNMLRYFVFVLKLTAYVIFRHKYDLVYAHDYFGTMPLLIMTLLRKGKKYIYDAHELFIPEDDIVFSRREKFFYFWEKKAVKKADLIVCPQAKRGELMKSHFGLSELPLIIRNISVLPDSPCTDTVKMNELGRFLKKEGTALVYAGAVTRSRNIHKLLEVVLDSPAEYKLVIIGDGPDAEMVRKTVSENGHENILYLGPVNYKELNSYISKCDISFISYPEKGLNNIHCAPNKIYEYASAGLPMIATENPSVREEFEKYQIGICSDDLKEAAQKVRNGLQDFRSRLKPFLDDNSWENESRKLLNSVQQMTE